MIKRHTTCEQCVPFADPQWKNYLHQMVISSSPSIIYSCFDGIQDLKKSNKVQVNSPTWARKSITVRVTSSLCSWWACKIVHKQEGRVCQGHKSLLQELPTAKAIGIMVSINCHENKSRQTQLLINQAFFSNTLEKGLLDDQVPFGNSGQWLKQISLLRIPLSLELHD